MGWLHELRVSDLPVGEELEVACRHCGHACYRTAGELSAYNMPGAFDGETISMAQAYLDQVEARLRCRKCGGPGRLSRLHGHLIEGFTGGLP